MRKILAFLLAAFLASPVIAAPAKVYVDTEQKYIFTDTALSAAIADVVDDENKQSAMAQKYIALMNPENGGVSIANLFAVCRAGGMNTYRQAGFDDCRNFVVKLLENTEQTIDEGAIGGFCPGLDENGKNPNGLRTITDKTRIGDFCSSTNIYSGEVIFRKDGTYRCTCLASACNPGYHFKGGACHTDEQPAAMWCPRSSHDETSANNTTQKCVEFCGAIATRNGCKYKNVVMQHSTKHCICNADVTEVDAAKASMQQAARNVPCPTSAHPETPQNNTMALCSAFCRAHANANNCKLTESLIQHSTKQCICNPGTEQLETSNLYNEVCGKDKGKTGKTERCVTDIFNWTNVQLMQAVALAKEYALVKYGQTITCSNKYRPSYNDDYVKCRSADGQTFYEFKFDDVKESIDADLQSSVKTALCAIHGGQYGVYYCENIKSAAACGKLGDSARKFGYTSTWSPKGCYFNKAYSNDLARVDGIDPFYFYTGIQIQANSSVEYRLKSYVQSVMGAQLKSFSCIKNPRPVDKIEGHSVKGSTDDVLRCTINGNIPVDFVFDDMSEFSDTYSNGGYQNIDCRVVGGEYNGHECMYMNEAQCNKLRALNASGCPSCKKISWDGKYCRLPSAADATELEKNTEIATLVGATVVGVAVTVATGGTAAPALALLTVETVGAGIEIYSTNQIHNQVRQFIENSMACQNAQCAESMLKSNLQRMANFANDVPDQQVNGIDAEFARLVGLIPSDSRFYQNLIANGTSTGANQKGFFDPNSWEPEQVWRAVGVTLQLTSLIKSIWTWSATKLTRTTAALRRGAAGAAGHADDASHALTHTPRPNGPAGGGGAAHAAGAADDAASAGRAGSAGSAAHSADDAAGAGRAGGAAGDAGHTGGAAGDAGRTGSAADDAGRAGNGAATAGTHVDDGARLHPDLDAYYKGTAAQRKSIYRRFAQEYHPDKWTGTPLERQANDLFSQISQLDSLSPEARAALSKAMEEFDEAAAAYRRAAAAAADNAASVAADTPNNSLVQVNEPVQSAPVVTNDAPTAIEETGSLLRQGDDVSQQVDNAVGLVETGTNAPVNPITDPSRLLGMGSKSAAERAQIYSDFVGVRDLGNWRYQDMFNKNRFMSHEAVRARINQLPDGIREPLLEDFDGRRAGRIANPGVRKEF